MEQKTEIDKSTEKRDVIIVTRRSFFGALVAIGSAGMGALLAVPMLRYVLYPLYAKGTGTEWSDVGEMSEFADSKYPVRKTVTLPSATAGEK